MSKPKHLILLCCLLLAAQLNYPFKEKNHTQDNDGVSIIVIAHISHTGTDKSNSVNATIDGHYLTVVFTENLGQVDVEITTSTGGYVQADSCITPNGIQFYIPNAGNYIVTFTLPNGDEYYGEFTVTD